METKYKEDIGYLKLKAISDKHPENVFLKISLQQYIPYTNPKGMSDEEYLYKALKAKYAL